jgi:hypothetical protein
MDENEKKIFELEHEKKLRDAFDKEREESDKSYAIKLTEKAVFGIVGLMGITIAGALIKVAIQYINAFLN